MAAVVGILVHDVGEIGRGDIEPLREQPRDQERYGRVVTEKRGRIVEFVDDGIQRCAHGRRVRPIKQHRHFPEHGAGLDDHSDDGAAPDDLDAALDQHEQVAGVAALVNDLRARRSPAASSTAAIIENFAHATIASASNRLGVHEAGWKRISWAQCSNCHQCRKRARPSDRATARTNRGKPRASTMPCFAEPAVRASTLVTLTIPFVWTNAESTLERF